MDQETVWVVLRNTVWFVNAASVHSSRAHRRFAAGGGAPGQVVVDLSLCGARRSKRELSALDDPSCVGLYGQAPLQEAAERAATPLDLAIAEMRDAGVHVVAEWQWSLPHQQQQQQQQGRPSSHAHHRIPTNP